MAQDEQDFVTAPELPDWGGGRQTHKQQLPHGEKCVTLEFGTRQNSGGEA